MTAHLFDYALGHREIVLPATSREGSRPTAAEDIIAIWRGEAEGVALATVLATLALALLALGAVATASEADARAGEQKPPTPEMQQMMEELTSLADGPPTFIDISEPIYSSPRT